MLIMDTSERFLEADSSLGVAYLARDVVVHVGAGEGVAELIGDLPRRLTEPSSTVAVVLRKTCDVTHASSSASDLRPASSASSIKAALQA
jgi:hypothetical protein